MTQPLSPLWLLGAALLLLAGLGGFVFVTLRRIKRERGQS